MKVIEMFRKFGLYSKELERINYHMNILSSDAKELIKRTLQEDPEKMSEEDLAKKCLEIMEKCDDASTKYDSKVDMEATRLGLRTDRFHSVKKCSKFRNNLFIDDTLSDYRDNEYDRDM